MTDDEALGSFRELFPDAVRVRLRADVPVATLLSGGGLGLGSLGNGRWSARASSDQPVTTFSARFDEAGFDEGA